jgi:hypothetical protein
LHELDEAALLNAVKRLQAGVPLQVLHSAILRRAAKIYENVSGNLRLSKDDGEFRRIVHFVYVSFKKGNLEPQEPFLRRSQRLDQQHLLDCDIESYFPEIPQVSKDGCVLLTATCYPEIDPSRSKSEFCAYLTSGAPQLPPQQELSAIVVNAFETRDVYHTTRGHWSSAHSPLKTLDKEYRGIWNLEDTYGVYSRGFGFLGLIRALGSEIPVTQGSSRDPNESGSQLYRRKFAPWSDPRYIYTDRKARMFILYKLFSREMQFWRVVARDRVAQDVRCCEYCAAMGEHDICDACKDFLYDRNQYSWFKGCVKGEEPFLVTALEGHDLQKRLDRSENHDLSLRQYIWNGRYNGPTDDDGDWAWNLDFYAKLEEPFHDIVDLCAQWIDFVNFCGQSRDRGFAGRERKRKRDEVSDEDAEQELHGDSDDARERLHDDLEE